MSQRIWLVLSLCRVYRCGESSFINISTDLAKSKCRNGYNMFYPCVGHVVEGREYSSKEVLFETEANRDKFFIQAKKAFDAWRGKYSELVK